MRRTAALFLQIVVERACKAQVLHRASSSTCLFAMPATRKRTARMTAMDPTPFQNGRADSETACSPKKPAKNMSAQNARESFLFISVLLNYRFAFYLAHPAFQFISFEHDPKRTVVMRDLI